MFVLGVLSVAGCAVNRLLHESTIFRMDALKNHVDGDGTRIFVSKDPEKFLGSEAFSA